MECIDPGSDAQMCSAQPIAARRPHQNCVVLMVWFFLFLNDKMRYLSFETRYSKYAVGMVTEKHALKRYGVGGVESIGRINHGAEGQRLKE